MSQVDLQEKSSAQLPYSQIRVLAEVANRKSFYSSGRWRESLGRESGGELYDVMTAEVIRGKRETSLPQGDLLPNIEPATDVILQYYD